LSLEPMALALAEADEYLSSAQRYLGDSALDAVESKRLAGGLTPARLGRLRQWASAARGSSSASRALRPGSARHPAIRTRYQSIRSPCILRAAFPASVMMPSISSLASLRRMRPSSRALRRHLTPHLRHRHGRCRHRRSRDHHCRRHHHHPCHAVHRPGTQRYIGIANAIISVRGGWCVVRPRAVQQ